MAQYRPVLVSDPGPRFDACREEARRRLDAAAREWAAGDPSRPDPAEVLEGIIDLFARQKFLRRPYGAGPT